MLDPIHGPARTARVILKAAVQELRLKAGDFLYEPPLRIAFKFRGLQVEDIWAGLEYAKAQGWLRFEPSAGAYTLTKAGFEAAPAPA